MPSLRRKKITPQAILDMNPVEFHEFSQSKCPPIEKALSEIVASRTKVDPPGARGIFPYGTNAGTVGRKRFPKWMGDVLAWLIAIIFVAVIVAALLVITGFSRHRCEGANGKYAPHFWGRCL